MSQNEITRYLNQASEALDLLNRYLDLLYFTANNCNGYTPKDVDRLHLMIETYRSNADGVYDDLSGIIQTIKRESRRERLNQQVLQPQENNVNG
jgi:hypothetical protein